MKLRLVAAMIALASAAPLAHAAEWPNRPIHFIVPFPPGGGTDVLGRLLAAELQKLWNESVIIDNRPGAVTNLGTDAAVRAPADGYTLVMLGPPAAINATLYDKLPFNVLRDITPVASMARAPNVMEVNPAVTTALIVDFLTK